MRLYGNQESIEKTPKRRVQKDRALLHAQQKDEWMYANPCSAMIYEILSTRFLPTSSLAFNLYHTVSKRFPETQGL